MAAYESLDGMAEVVDTRTSIVQRVPREWLTDPLLGRFIERTNAQLALDHELVRPPADIKVADLRDLAVSADVDLGAASTKAEIFDVLDPYFAAPDDEDPTDGGNADGTTTPTPTTPAAGDNNPTS